MFLLDSVLGCVFSSCVVNVILSHKALYMGPIWSVKSQAGVCDLQSHSELTFGFLLQLPITGGDIRVLLVW